MKRDIKAVFFDIDGTLFLHDQQYIAPSSLDAIREMHANGIKLVVCTGRNRAEYNILPEAIRDLPFDACITAAGGCVDMKERVVQARTFSLPDVLKIIDVAMEHKVELYFMDDQKTGLIQKPSALVKEAIMAYHGDVPPVCEIRPFSVHHFIAFCTPEQDELLRNELHQIEYHRSSERTVDLYPLGTNKQAGIEVVLREWNLDRSQIMAFGDSFNDVEMLRYAGVGVAMGNGSTLAKEAADYICEPIEQDGIYLTCKQFGLI